jgi:hypothetical protein
LVVLRESLHFFSGEQSEVVSHLSYLRRREGTFGRIQVLKGSIGLVESALYVVKPVKNIAVNFVIVLRVVKTLRRESGWVPNTGILMGCF